ncbi:king tubby 1-like protein [Obelidium mucronatum]|nr:king tubby 1-like protein [Obelidium mucronatum]
MASSSSSSSQLPLLQQHQRAASSSLRNVYSATDDEDEDLDDSEGATVVADAENTHGLPVGSGMPLNRSESQLELFQAVVPLEVPAIAAVQPPERNHAADRPIQWNNANDNNPQDPGVSLLPVPESELPRYSLQPVAHPHDIKCKIHRKKSFSSGGKSYPSYELFIEDNDRLVFYLSARKQNFVNKSSHYAISTDRLANWSNKSIIAHVRSNFIGTAFSIYSNANGSPKMKFGVQEEFCAVLYEPNILGVKGPRKMTVIIPAMEEDGTRYQLKPDNERDTLLFRSKKDVDKDIHVMHNKTPQWNPETESFVLNFSNRVTMASVKNFQIVHDHDLDYIIMQFGRIASDKFTMDYRYPMTAVQAFGIALTSFDAKLACE